MIGEFILPDHEDRIIKVLERLARKRLLTYLIERHCEVIERNWRIREGEIDIVALNPTGIFSFVEVKTQ
jgi:Holliday junction resolvase-like predicted endonuclease